MSLLHHLTSGCLALTLCIANGTAQDSPPPWWGIADNDTFELRVYIQKGFYKMVGTIFRYKAAHKEDVLLSFQSKAG